jgi:hypothetical protein
MGASVSLRIWRRFDVGGLDRSTHANRASGSLRTRSRDGAAKADNEVRQRIGRLSSFARSECVVTTRSGAGVSSAGRSVASMTLTQFIVLAVNFATALVTAWWLGALGRGTMTMASIGPALTASLGVFGVSQAIAFYAASPDTDDGDVYAWTWISSGVLGLGWLLVWLTCAPLASRTVLQGVAPALLRLSALSIPLDIVARNAASYALGKGHVGLYNRVDLVSVVSRFFALAVAVMAFGYGVTGAVAAGVVSSSMAALYAVLCVARMGHPTRSSPTRDTFRKLTSYGRRVWVGSLSQQVNFRLDYFLVNYFVGTSEVGVYSVATRLAEIVLVAPRALAKVWFVRVARSDAEARLQDLERHGDDVQARLCSRNRRCAAHRRGDMARSASDVRLGVCTGEDAASPTCAGDGSAGCSLAY